MFVIFRKQSGTHMISLIFHMFFLFFKKTVFTYKQSSSQGVLHFFEMVILACIFLVIFTHMHGGSEAKYFRRNFCGD